MTDQGLLRVSGADAALFLQGQTTSDVLALPPDHAGYGALCTPKGRVIANFRLLRSGRGFYLLLPAELAEIIRKRLQTYVLRSKVVVEDLTADYGAIGLLGAGLESLADGCGVNIPAAPGSCQDQPDALSLRLSDGTGRCLIASRTAVIPRLLECLSEKLGRVDSELWRLADIRAGIPEVVAGTREEFLPQMLNLDLLGGIGFKKGCYTGQEIVTRTHYLGQLKRRMFRLSSATEATPPAGAPVYEVSGAEPRAIGTVVAAARGDSGKTELLAVLSVEHCRSGNLRLIRPDGPAAGWLPLPYSIDSPSD